MSPRSTRKSKFAIVDLVGSNQFISYPHGLCHSFIGCPARCSFLFQEAQRCCQWYLLPLSLFIFNEVWFLWLWDSAVFLGISWYQVKKKHISLEVQTVSQTVTSACTEVGGKESCVCNYFQYLQQLKQYIGWILWFIRNTYLGHSNVHRPDSLLPNPWNILRDKHREHLWCRAISALVPQFLEITSEPEKWNSVLQFSNAVLPFIEL